MDDYQKRLDTMKAILKANLEKKKQEQQKNKVVKTSNVDTAPTPIEKANALKKKESSKLFLPELNIINYNFFNEVNSKMNN